MAVIMRRARGVCVGAGSIAISLAVVLALPGPARAARHATSTRPVILALTVSHSRKILPAHGARVKVTVRVQNATRCVFFRQKKPRTRLTAFKQVSCKGGSASVRVPRIPNPYFARVRLTFAVKAIGTQNQSVQRKVRLTEAAAPRRPAVLLSISPQSLPSSGGSVTLTYWSKRAKSCSLSSSSALWSGSNPKSVSCIGKMQVTVPSASAQTQWNVTFTAKGPGGKASASSTLTQQASTSTPTASLTISPHWVPASGGSVTLTYSSTNGTSCSLSSSSALWSGSNPLPVSCNGSTPVTVPASTSASQWTVTFTVSGSGGQASASDTLTQGTTFTSSLNWAGYAVPSTSVVTSVSGRFTVPTLTCTTTPNGVVTTWVGTGGAVLPDGSPSGDLLQTGVDSYCSGGVQVDAPAWWEEYPELPSINFDSMSVSPGDQIEASVYYVASNSMWVTRVDDLSTGISGLMQTGNGWGTIRDSDPTHWLVWGGDTSSLTYSGGYTAEWIVEDFSQCSSGSCSLLPLADFGTITFSDLTTGPALTVSSADALGIVQGGTVLAVPSPVSGNSFSVTYTG